ncbi:MAG: (2Fe-2S)-binding protein [Gammaproteobacteria bacterium]|nr:(2Fe-2S)-binding protein [Gammaproteobacteria bacterium]
MSAQIEIDNQTIPFTAGQTIMQAAAAAGIYIPHLCHHPDLPAHGSCKLCTVSVNGRNMASCTTPAEAGQQIGNQTPALQSLRLRLIQMLFIEGNHLCPTCEKSGHCRLQATAYDLGMLDSHFPHFYRQHGVDSSHPDLLLDRNRCIYCSLCVRASRDLDGKGCFVMSGRGINKSLAINSPSGQLGDSAISANDRAVSICPTGALLPKQQGFTTPIGKRHFDTHLIRDEV